MPAIEHITFSGLIRTRDFRDLTHTEIVNALRINGWVEHSNNRQKFGSDGKPTGEELTHKSGGHVHFVHALIARGPSFGINTLGQFAVAMRNGHTQSTQGQRFLRFIPSGAAYVVFEPDQGWLITFRHV